MTKTSLFKASFFGLLGTVLLATIGAFATKAPKFVQLYKISSGECVQTQTNRACGNDGTFNCKNAAGQVLYQAFDQTNETCTQTLKTSTP